MATPEVDRGAMSRHWDEFARRDAFFYIATTKGKNGAEAFYASGSSPVEEMMAWIGPEPGRRSAVDIGCGVCRVSLHLAEHFDRVDGIDVSQEMIDRARARGLPDNIHLHLGSGRDLAAVESDSADLVFSGWVLQHIPDLVVIRSYFGEIARVLAPRGRAVIQIDTRPDHVLVRAYKALPDAVLPRLHRRYIRRYRRDAGLVRRMLDEAGLTIVGERRPDSDKHWFLLAQ